MTRMFKIAAAQYPLDEFKSQGEYEAKITRWVEEAVGDGAELLAIGEMNRPQWVYAEVDMEKLAHVRNTGGVQTYNHWSEQPGAGVLPRVKIVSLI